MYKDIDYNPIKDELRKFYGQYQESSKGKNVEQTRVGSCTTWSRNVSLVIVSSWLHCVPLVAYSLTVSFSQFMSPRLKSPPVFMYKDIDYNPIKDELRKFYGQYQESSKGKNVEQLWTEFKDKIHSLMNEQSPISMMLLMYFQYDCLSAFCRCAFVSLYLFKSILSFGPSSTGTYTRNRDYR
jgi:acyl-CoA-binding protein